MNNQYTHPKLRWPLDFQYQSFENEHVLILRCPLGISEQPLVLVAGVGQILSDFNGQNSIADLANKYSVYGVTVPLINELVQLLDNSYFLDSDRFKAYSLQIRADYQAASERIPFLAGPSYPSGATELRNLISNYLGQEVNNQNDSRNMLGLMAPHIDYRRGSVCYGLAYRHLPTNQHDLYVLLGTAHQYSPYMFHLTAKDFLTPLGSLPCDKALTQRLANSYGPVRSFADEILHRREHSLELQTPFLRHLNNRAQILPILIGSFNDILLNNKYPNEVAEYDEFAAALANTLLPELGSGRKIAIIAGVDIAHVGRHFGDKDSLNPKFMEEIERRDREYLATIAANDKQALFDHIASDHDARRVCGYPTMYLMLDLLERLNLPYQAECFDYRQAVDYQTDCAVTFAGMGLYSPFQKDFPS